MYGRTLPAASAIVFCAPPDDNRKRPGYDVDEPPHSHWSLLGPPNSSSEHALKSRLDWRIGSLCWYEKKIVALPLPLAKLLPIVMLMFCVWPSRLTLPGT